MKATVKMFFHIISSVLNGTKSNTEGFCDWQKLYRLAKSHSCVSYLYYALNDDINVDSEVMQDIVKDTLAVRNQQAQQEYYAEQLFRGLQDGQIDYVEMKGRTLRCIYPYSDLRPSCDIDFLYRKDKSNRKKIFHIIEEMGGKFLSSYFNDDAFAINHLVSVEAHHSLMATDKFYDKYYKTIWERLEKTQNRFEYKFSDEELYLYCLIHAKKHFLLGGCGVRSIIDLFMLRKKFSHIFTPSFIEKIKLLQVYKFELMVNRLSEVWIEGKVADEEVFKVSKYILQGGTLGNDFNQALAENVGASVGKTKRRLFFKKVFPHYRELVKNYKFLKPLPFLLPFVWVYRWIKILFTNNKKIRQEIRISSSINEENVNMVNDVFRAVDDHYVER